MIAFICLFLPSYLMSIYISGRNNDYNLKKLIAIYSAAVLYINTADMAVLTLLFGYSGNLTEDLCKYTSFPCKYILLSICFGVVIPWIYYSFKDRIKIKVVKFEKKDHCISEKKYKIAIWTVGICLILLNFSRIFDNYFWGDETYSIWLSRMTIGDMLAETASDVHPPLYYIFLMGLTHLIKDCGWVYHLSALIPYILIVLFSLTFVSKRFGKIPAVLLMLFSTFLNESTVFNVEVRMYALAELLVLLAYWGLLLILSEPESKKGYLVFTLASLGAAYSHYYALFAVAFFYLVLLVKAIKNRKMRKTVVVTFLATILGYCPWLFSMVKTFERTADDFWISTIPTFKECLLFFFDSGREGWKPYSTIMMIIFVVAMIFLVVREKEYVKLEKEEKIINLVLSNGTGKLSVVTEWLLYGIFSAFGTMILGFVISIFIHPAFLPRYLYPVSVVIWLILSIVISELPSSKILAAAVLILTLISCIPNYIFVYSEEKDNNARCLETQSALIEYIGKNDTIVTNDLHLYRTGLRYYLPGVENYYHDYDDFSDEKKYWLVWDCSISDEYLSMFDQYGYEPIPVYENGVLGDIPVYIYDLKKDLQVTDTDTE